MAEKHLTDGTTALAAQPRVIKIEAAEKPQNAQLRVAAYTRVSSDSDDQLNSFAAQNRYYAELISGKAEWRMVDIYAAFAQKESESISGNMRWSYQRRMEAGTFLPSSMAYGYKLVGRKIEIDADAALVVCRIFQWYLNGVNRIAIAKMLNEEGISSGQQKNGTVPLSDTSSPTKNTQEIPCGKKPTPAIHFLRPATKTPVSMNSITQ